jgi:hypothetical protein
MSRYLSLVLVVLVGCSTQPCIDVKDYFRPGKIGPNQAPPYGGVCNPQGPITGPGPYLPAVPAISVPVVPPPAPLPPPTGGVPPAGPAPSIFPTR